MGIVGECHESWVDFEAEHYGGYSVDLWEPEGDLAGEVEESGRHGVDGDAAEGDSGLTHCSGRKKV